MSDKTLKGLLVDVYAETKEAVNEHGHFHSAHEAYAVIAEELDEFWEEVRKKRIHRNKLNMKKELIQIAAAAVKAIESLKL